MNRFFNFELHHRILAFVLVMIGTIVFTRLAVQVYNPNPFLFHLEVHHFDYGIVLLIVTSLLLLFDVQRHFLYLLPAGIGMGLVLDEYFFIRKGALGTETAQLHSYNASISLVVLAVIIIVLGLLLSRSLILRYRKK